MEKNKSNFNLITLLKEEITRFFVNVKLLLIRLLSYIFQT